MPPPPPDKEAPAGSDTDGRSDHKRGTDEATAAVDSDGSPISPDCAPADLEGLSPHRWSPTPGKGPRQALAELLRKESLEPRAPAERRESRIEQLAEERIERLEADARARARWRADTRPVVERMPRLDWKEARAKRTVPVEFLAGKLMTLGQQITVPAPAKLGKSLFWFDWACHAAAGWSFLGDKPRLPRRVLYLNRENTDNDLVDWLDALGYDEADLGLLDMRSFPEFSGTLDTSDQAAVELLELVDGTAHEVVILDTGSRFVQGSASDEQTWRSMYRLVMEPLKRRNVSSVRIDHTGKDESKGGIGSSAKVGDVDHVWQMSAPAPARTTLDGTDPLTGLRVERTVCTLKLERTHTRSGIGPESIWVERHGRKIARADRDPDNDLHELWLPGGTRHVAVPGSVVTDTPDGVEWSGAAIASDLAKAARITALADLAVSRGAPIGSQGMGRDRLRDWARSHRIGGLQEARNETLAAVAKELKQRQVDAPEEPE